ncbi:hypothetical protein GCK72_006965 [Caenorhabditis remanei]|uniref:Uncharacterized protein n=1 Tax=Caenorhabditis remanei TaxID=31234 RepID=A0A6A5HKA7_CAERE|nr:hypothetical protein GCK72_006965 [Caenorhabditis remanei]KAF1767007.1 hypothetical protein GCK72_006965 [Caenorhabditis remanei]
MDRSFGFSYAKIGILLLSVSCVAIYTVTSTEFLALFRPNFDMTLSVERKAFVYEKMIEALRNGPSTCEEEGLYCKRPETQHVDCGRVLEGDKTYLQTLTGDNRIPLISDPILNMSCSAINSRIRPRHLHFEPLKLGGTAFARIVYTDYEFIEKQVQVSYHPQNLFCFAIDKKAPREFHDDMKSLSECLPNIILLPATESYDSNGHNNNLAHYRCMKAVVSRRDWSYLMLLQNHDVITKSVYELDRIFDLLGGANDVSVSPEMKRRRTKNLKWDPKSLKMFKNESEVETRILNSEMTMASGYVQGSLSRAAVEWLTQKVDLTNYINQWNLSRYGGDEQFIPTFQMNADLGMPGHFTDECIRRGEPGAIEITRMTHWWDGTRESCASKTVRNEICIFGIEDFRAVAAMPSLMFNKMIPSFDYSIVECTAELIYNRTFLGQVNYDFAQDYYENLVPIRYHKHHKEPGYVLNCTSDYERFKYQDYIN